MAEDRKKRLALLDVLRVMAILPVLSAHPDPIPPIPAPATGGAAGNGLFCPDMADDLIFRRSTALIFQKKG